MFKLDFDKQKSPQRRFLFILGATLFVGIFILGLLIMFWKALPINLNDTQRYSFGGIFIVYGILRFVRIMKAGNHEQ